MQFKAGKGVSRRRRVWTVGGIVCLMLLGLAADRSAALRMANGVSREPNPPFGGHDPVTDQFLQRFEPLRRNPAERHTIAAEVVAAANKNRLDPDLLFALIAVESNFSRSAVSPKGARGLGQVMYRTGRAVAPTLVHRPGDLYDARRNLAITAQHLHDLLIARGGDLRAALTDYHLGPHTGQRPRRNDDRYVGLICTYYASLKVRRRYGEMVAMNSGDTGSSER